MSAAGRLERLAGQLLVAGWEAQDRVEAPLREALKGGALGGLIAFRRNFRALPYLARALGEALGEGWGEGAPPLLAVDQEGGRVQRLGPPVLQLPPAARLGQGDPALTERAAEVLGRQLRALGLTMDLAPVLDVRRRPDDPVIGDRAFGERPENVIAHGGAFARGLARAGVLCCGKHFPGHGAASVDSHIALPRVALEPEAWRKVHLRPFEALAAALPAVMTAHLVAEGLDDELPATLSPRVLDEWLRGRLGFQGVVMSDDLQMGALRAFGALEEVAVRAVRAGCDALLVCEGTEQVLAVRARLASEAGREPAFERRLREAGERFASMRASVPPPRPIVEPERLAEALAATGAFRLQAELAAVGSGQ